MKEKCNQTSCTHHPDNDLIPKGREKDLMCSMCPICPSCKSEPHIVETDCSECMACENIPNKIRGGNDVGKIMQDQIVEVQIPPEVMQELIIEKQIGGGK